MAYAVAGLAGVEQLEILIEDLVIALAAQVAAMQRTYLTRNGPCQYSAIFASSVAAILSIGVQVGERNNRVSEMIALHSMPAVALFNLYIILMVHLNTRGRRA